MFDTIRPFCKGHVLEVGSGIGNLSRHFLEENFTLTASDLRDEYINILHGEFGKHPRLKGIRSIDLALPDFEQRYAGLLESFDTVVALNVIEHIKEHERAIANCKKLLKPGGHLVVLVPAFQSLYNSFDEELGHWLRYNAKKPEPPAAVAEYGSTAYTVFQCRGNSRMGTQWQRAAQTPDTTQAANDV
jgi:2-polyprenyl-3-methyl-5-hydroxy-6-metoxy-1,4-benzoquinol methylase